MHSEIQTARQRKTITVEDIDKQKAAVMKDIVMFETQYCYDGELARWSNIQLYNAYNNPTFLPYKITGRATFHTGYHLTNTTLSTMIYFLFKKMTFESWGKEEAKEGNEIAITMGFRTINVPAVDNTFLFQKNEFAERRRANFDEMPKQMAENINEWEWDNRAWWESYAPEPKEDDYDDYDEDENAFPPKDRDGDYQTEVEFPLTIFAPAKLEKIHKQQYYSPSSSSSSAAVVQTPQKCKKCGSGELQRGASGSGEQLNICRICGDTTIIKGGKRKKTKRRKKRRKKTHKKKKNEEKQKEVESLVKRENLVAEKENK